MATHLTLKRDTGGVLVVQPGGAVWIGTATMPAPRATTWTRLNRYSCSICRGVQKHDCGPTNSYPTKTDTQSKGDIPP